MADKDIPVSVEFFCASLEALRQSGGSRIISGPEGGFHPNLDAIRRHLGHAEALFRGLPRAEGRGDDEKAVDLGYFARIVARLREEAHDFGLEAFPPNFWESCEEIERYLEAAADRLREGGRA